MRQSDDEAIGDLVRHYADGAPDVARPVIVRDRGRPQWLPGTLIAAVIVVATGTGLAAAGLLGLRGPLSIVPGATASPTEQFDQTDKPSPAESASPREGTPTPSAIPTEPPSPPPATQPTPTLTSQITGLNALRTLWAAQDFDCDESEEPISEVQPGSYLHCGGTRGSAELLVTAYFDLKDQLHWIRMSVTSSDTPVSAVDQSRAATVLAAAPVPGTTRLAVQKWIFEAARDAACFDVPCEFDAEETSVLVQSGERGGFGVEIRYEVGQN